MALIEDKIFQIVDEENNTYNVALYAEEGDLRSDEDYAIFPIIGPDGQTKMYIQMVRSDLEQLPSGVEKTPLYYYPDQGIISSYQLCNATAAIKLWAVVLIQGDNQTIHVYTPSKDDSNKQDHTTSFLIEDGATYDAEVIPEDTWYYTNSDIIVTPGGNNVEPVINYVIEKQPTNESITLSLSASEATASFPTQSEGLYEGSDASSLEEVSTTVQLPSIKENNGAKFYGTFTVENKVSPSNAVTNLQSEYMIPEDSASNEFAFSDYLNLSRMIQGGSLYFNFSNLQKLLVLVDLSYYARDNISNYKTITEIPQENLEYLNSGLAANNMKYIFSNCQKLTYIPKLIIDTSNVTDMDGAFYYCQKLTSLDVSNWDTSNVTTANSVFSGCSSLTSLDLSNWNTEKIETMKDMFYGCNSLTSIGDISNWDTSNVTNMYRIFYNCQKLTSLNLSNWNTSNVTDMRYIFWYCSSLTSLDLSNWNTSKITYIGSMFENCESLTSIGDISNWDTSNVTNMSYMFYGCRSLSYLDLSNWNVKNVTDSSDFLSKNSMVAMFENCESLTYLDISNWDTSNVTSMIDMFYNCPKLEHIEGVIDMSSCTSCGDMFKGCTELTGVKIKNPPSNFESSTGLTSSQYEIVS